MKKLVVYYSLTGNTKSLAENISKSLNCDIEEIIDKKNRRGFFGFLAAGRDAFLKRITEIDNIKKDPKNYDMVIIGTPVWAGKITPAIRTYLLNNKDKIKKFAFFTTSGASASDKIVKNLEDILNKKCDSFLNLSTKEIKNTLFKEKLENFLKVIKD